MPPPNKRTDKFIPAGAAFAAVVFAMLAPLFIRAQSNPPAPLPPE